MGRRGSLNVWITVEGKQGHVAYPERSANPIPVLLRLLDRLGSNRLDDVRPGSSGKPVPGYELKILDPDGMPVAQGEAGDLYVKGDSALALYWAQELAAQNATLRRELRHLAALRQINQAPSATTPRPDSPAPR